MKDAALQLLYRLAMGNISSILDAPLSKIPHIDVVAKAFNDGEPLEVIVGLYFEATESVSDDEILEKVGDVLDFIHNDVPKILEGISTRPAKDILAELLGGLSVPDFDQTEGNEVKVIDLINRTMAELAD